MLALSILLMNLAILDYKETLNPFKLNGFFHSYYLEKSILYFRGVRLIFSSLAQHKMIFFCGVSSGFALFDYAPFMGR